MDAQVELSLSAWKGLPNYGCPYCPFEQLDERTVLDHVYERHPNKPQPKPVNAHLFDAAGNLIPKSNLIPKTEEPK